MQGSIVQTLSVPSIGSGEPSRLFQASPTSAFRVVIRNVGGSLLMISHDVADLSSINALGAVYQLPTAQADVFVLAPGQSIFAASQGAGGQASIAVSEAIPIGKTYMES